MLLGAVGSRSPADGGRPVFGTLAAAIVTWVAADLIYLFDVGSLVGIADVLVMTGGVGLALAMNLRSDRRGSVPMSGGRGLFLPVGFGMAALVVLSLGIPFGLNNVALAFGGTSLRSCWSDVHGAEREPRAPSTPARSRPPLTR